MLLCRRWPLPRLLVIVGRDLLGCRRILCGAPRRLRSYLVQGVQLSDVGPNLDRACFQGRDVGSHGTRLLEQYGT